MCICINRYISFEQFAVDDMQEKYVEKSKLIIFRPMSPLFRGTHDISCDFNIKPLGDLLFATIDCLLQSKSRY